MNGIFITGTNTGVGKTYIGCLLAEALHRKGINVVPRKPVESGCTAHNNELVAADATALYAAAAYAGSLSDVCAYRFEQAISPARAAHLNNQQITIEQLTSHCLKGVTAKSDFLLVEGAGGFYSPLCSDGLNADLAEALDLPVLLISDNKLGCINQVLLSTEAILNRQLKLAAVILNHQAGDTSESTMDNETDLRGLLDYPVLSLMANPADQQAFIEQLSQLLI